jgi:Zn-finger nucleic acid-binding protein
MELKMKCSVFKDIDLVMSDRQGVEIDYCQSCRGVWLDRGELDKIIERSSMQNNSSSKPQYEQLHNKYDKHNQQGYHKKKKEGFLSEIFDFDF